MPADEFIQKLAFRRGFLYIRSILVRIEVLSDEVELK